MTPAPLPLLDRAARESAAAARTLYKSDPAGDHQASAGFDPGHHAAVIADPPPDFRAALASVQYFRDPDTGAWTAASIPLHVPRPGGVEVGCGLAALYPQYLRALGPAGWWPRILRHLRTPARPPAPPLPPPPGLAHPLVAAHAAAGRRCVLALGSGVRAEDVVADLARAAPGRRIALAVSRRRDAGHLAAELRRAGVDARAFCCSSAASGPLPPPPRVAVGIYPGLSNPAARSERCRLVVVTDAVHSAGPAGRLLRGEPGWENAAWVGLVRAGEHRSPLERDRLVCFFGPDEFALPAHGVVNRRVLFAVAPVAAGRWRDAGVMALAGAVAAGRPPDRLAGVTEAGVGGPVVVLARDGTHRDALLDLRRGRPVGVVTADGLTALGSVGVLVRADGRGERPPLPAAALVEPQTARTPLLVVDATAPDPRKAAGAYRDAGWASLAAAAGRYADWERWVHRRPRFPRRRAT